MLVLHTYLAYIRLFIVHYYLHTNIQTIQSLSHFILLTWYQSHSSDFLVFVDIFGVLSLPSPSSSRYCQKRATAVTPTVLQHSNINVLCIQLPKNRHRKTEQSIPSKTQPRTAKNCTTRAPTRRLKFLPHEHAQPRAVNISYVLTRASSHAPHVLPCAPRACSASRIAT